MSTEQLALRSFWKSCGQLLQSEKAYLVKAPGHGQVFIPAQSVACASGNNSIAVCLWGPADGCLNIWGKCNFPPRQTPQFVSTSCQHSQLFWYNRTKTASSMKLLLIISSQSTRLVGQSPLLHPPTATPPDLILITATSSTLSIFSLLSPSNLVRERIPSNAADRSTHRNASERPFRVRYLREGLPSRLASARKPYLRDGSSSSSLRV